MARKRSAATQAEAAEAPPAVQPEVEPPSGDDESPPTTPNPVATPTAERTGGTEAQPLHENPYTEETTDESPKASSDKESQNFSQEEVDEIVRKRLARERQKTTKAETDATGLNEQVADLQADKESTTTELRAQKRAGKELKSELTKAHLANALILEATKQQVDPEAVAQLVDMDLVQMEEDGSWSNLADLVTGVLERYPGLSTVKRPASSPVNPPGEATESTPAESDADRYKRYFMGGGGAFFRPSPEPSPSGSGGLRFFGEPEDLE